MDTLVGACHGLFVGGVVAVELVGPLLVPLEALVGLDEVTWRAGRQGFGRWSELAEGLLDVIAYFLVRWCVWLSLASAWTEGAVFVC